MRPGSDAMRLPNRSGAPPEAGEVAWNTYLKRRGSNHDTHRGDALKASAVLPTMSSRESTVLIVLYRCVMLFLSTADRERPKPKEVFIYGRRASARKNGIYYVVLTYKTYDGKRKTKWQSTGLPIKGNKRRAEAMMRDLQDDFEPPVDPNGPPSKAMLFADYLVQWLEIAKSTVKLTTYASYKELSNSRIIVESNGTKTKSSKRTLPLVPVFRERLLALQEEQKENRKLCGRCYNKKYADYICVDAMGNLLKPDYLSDSFQIILRNYHLRRIRFHDLRHSCASLLLANGVPMKMIQEWLGHSDFSTTANIYSHLDYASKVSSAEAMLNGLGMGSNPENDT